MLTLTLMPVIVRTLSLTGAGDADVACMCDRDSPDNTFNAEFGAGSLAACISCSVLSAHMVTTQPGNGDGSACVCSAGYYLAVGSVCEPCVEGMNCSRSGVSLATVPLEPGYWRTGPSSATLLPCRVQGVCVGSGSNGSLLDDLEALTVNAASALKSESVCADRRTGPQCEVCAQPYVNHNGT